MVGRLVQEQDIRVAKECLGQEHPHLQGRVQLGHLLVVVFLADAQSVQELGRIGLGIPAIQLGKLRLQLTGTDAVLITEIRLGIDGILFVHNIHQMLVAHDDSAEHLILVIGIMVLLQDGHALPRRNVDGALGRLNITAQKLQESGFAGTIGTDDAVAIARRELDRYVLKEDALAKLQCYTAS